MKKLLQISFIFIVIVSSATILNSCRKFTKTSSGLSSSDDDVDALNCPCNNLKCWEEKTSQVTKAAGECLSETIDIAGPKALEKGLKYINVALEMKGIFQHLKVYTVILDTVRKERFSTAFTRNLKQLGNVSECEKEGSKALDAIAIIFDKFVPIFTSSSDTQVVEEETDNSTITELKPGTFEENKKLIKDILEAIRVVYDDAGSFIKAVTQSGKAVTKCFSSLAKKSTFFSFLNTVQKYIDPFTDGLEVMIAFVDCLSCVGDGGIALIANTGCAIKDWNNTFKQIKSEKSIVPNPHCDIYEKTASIGLMTNYGKVLNQKAETSVKPDLWASTVSTCKKIVFPTTIVVDTITSDPITQPSLSKNKAKYCYENCATDKRKQNCRAVVQELSKTVPGYSKCLNHCDYPVSSEVGIKNCISYCCYDQACYDQAIDLWGGY